MLLEIEKEEKQIQTYKQTWAYLEQKYNIHKIWTHQDNKASYSNHCLHHLLPVAKSINCVLRDIGGHGLLIDHVTSELHKRTFINRMLFSNCYW